jgi:coenzyme F420-reducing hydrogenase beta subunit
MKEAAELSDLKFNIAAASEAAEAQNWESVKTRIKYIKEYFDEALKRGLIEDPDARELRYAIGRMEKNVGNLGLFVINTAMAWHSSDRAMAKYIARCACGK